jgi:hypothetical protein
MKMRLILTLRIIIESMAIKSDSGVDCDMGYGNGTVLTLFDRKGNVAGDPAREKEAFHLCTKTLSRRADRRS